ncbi:sigma 54-interacting transcriptional regulator [Archangium lansingense]|uniref:Sigma-54 dependent transcriptional regulator n=1 Tax=Archangium lansingense TaxID=2995310 RepID=A0ABT4ALR0_9BACT|nr:sigma-54 dependent transcriptional regulator [Archangium lansinium]MCY1082634.1 sigma-54 dependent transcriptional regulator [Archangium lansinium]
MQKKISDDSATTAANARGRERPTARTVPALTIVAHPKSERIGERLLLEMLAAAGRTASLSRNAPDFARPGSLLARPLGDAFLSRKPVRFEPGARGRLRLVVPEDGTPVRVGGEPVRGSREFTMEALAAGVPLELSERVVLLLHLAHAPEVPSVGDLGMVGQSERLRRVREDVCRVADLNVPVLIRGETGSGKELVARALHQQSPRRDGPFISVNLGALPRELVSAELFGVQRGAYTGAMKDREGIFRAAHGGTLFLDEVGEAPPEVQVALLRVLETGEVFPVGGQASVHVDVRLITATDAHLEERIRQGLFKAPLLHRLAGFEIQVPPLRERREDIGPLFLHFARQELEATGEASRLAAREPQDEPWLPTSLAVRLVRYEWPGNVRQLRNVTRQLIIGSRGLPHLRVDARLEQELDSAALPLPGHSLSVFPAPANDNTPMFEDLSPSRRKPSDVGEQELLEALRACAWDLKATAERLGISRASIYMIIEKSSLLRTAGDLSPEEISRCFRECQGDLDQMVKRLEVSKRALQRRVRELGLAGG